MIGESPGELSRKRICKTKVAANSSFSLTPEKEQLVFVVLFRGELGDFPSDHRAFIRYNANLATVLHF